MRLMSGLFDFPRLTHAVSRADAWLTGRPNLKKIAGNAFWLLVEKILRLGLGLGLGIWLARYLGPEQFGMLNYAIAFVAIFGTLSGLGLYKIVVREIAAAPAREREILGTAFVLKAAAGLVSLMLAIFLSAQLHPNEPLATYLVAILSIASFFQSFEVIEFWFEANIRSKYSVYAKQIAFLLVTLVKVALILAEAPLIAFVWAALAESVLASFALLGIYCRKSDLTPLRWKPSIQKAKDLLSDSWPLIFAGMAVILYMKIDIIMLGEMKGSEVTGIYSSAAFISEIWYFIPTILGSSLFPLILRARQTNVALYHDRLQNLYRVLFWLAVVIAICVSVTARPLIITLYGSAYEEASQVLHIHIWAGIAVFLGVGSSQYLLAENLQRISLYRTAIGLVVNIALNILMIPRYGANGAAFATLISYFVATFSIVLFKPARGQGRMLLRAMNPSGILSAMRYMKHK